MIEETIIMQIDEAETLTADLSRSFTATSQTDGFMSKEDKAKLDGMEPGSEKNRINSISVLGQIQEPDETGAVDLAVAAVKFFG